jgi:hypothetical protein
VSSPRARWLGAAVLDLTADGPVTGTVLARFPGALHVEFGGFVVIVVRAGAPRLPNGIGLAAAAIDKIAAPAGAPARLTDAGLEAGQLAIGWDPGRPPRWTGLVPRWDSASRRALEDRATAVLAACGGRGVRPAPIAALARIDGFEAERGGGEAVATVIEAIGDRDPSTAARAGRLLVGRGPGLTPVGDDIVAATALTVAAMGGGWPAERRRAWLRALVPPEPRKRTTAVSATLLELATGGLGVAPVHRLLDPDPGVARRLSGPVARLRRFGRTSGPAYATTVGAVALALAAPTSTNPRTKENPCP